MSVATSFDWTALPTELAVCAPEGADIGPMPSEVAGVRRDVCEFSARRTEPEPATVPASVGFTPREYQVEAESAIWREWDSGKRSTLGVMSTGGGKTIVFGMVAKRAIEERGGRVLILAHRDELLEQAQAKLSFVGVASAIEKADQKARKAIDLAGRDYFHRRDIRCVVGSVASLKGKRLETWPRDYFTHLIVDECHHSTAKSYKAVTQHFASALRLGVTATPTRHDKTNLGEVYQSEAFNYPLPWMIENGHLAPIVWAKSDVQIDLRLVNACAGDLNQGDLEDAISPHIQEMVRAIKWNKDGTPNIGDRRGIMFTPGRKKQSQKIRPCEAFADGLRRIGIPAQAVWGDHPDRLAIIRGFRHGEFQILCGTPSLLGEGVDFPFAEVGILGCPTMSAELFAQEVGRITRLSPETGKTNALIIDFNWLIDKHKLCTPFTLVCPEGAEDEARIAAQIVASGEETDILKAADLARDRAEAERERKAKLEAERELAKAKAEEIKRAREDGERAKRERLDRDRINLRVRDGSSGLEFRRFDPFASLFSLAGLNPRRAPVGSIERVSPGQVKILVDLGMNEYDARALSAEDGRQMQAFLYPRYKANLAWPNQVKRLMGLGVEQAEALQYTKWDAQRLIKKLGGNRPRRYG